MEGLLDWEIKDRLVSDYRNCFLPVWVPGREWKPRGQREEKKHSRMIRNTARSTI